MIFPPSHTLIEKKIAQALALAVRHMAAHETWVQSSATAHIGQVIVVHVFIFGRPLDLAWRVDGEDILKAIPAQAKADVTLNILPTAYAALAELPFDTTRIMRHVQIVGDAALAEWVNRLTQQLRPNIWEDLSSRVGDIPAYYLQQGAGLAFTHAKKTVQRLTQHAQHTLLDKKPVWIRHAHLDEFSQKAQDLRYALERLEQRVTNLKATRP